MMATYVGDKMAVTIIYKILVTDFPPIYFIFLTFDLILGHDFNDDFSTE